MFKSQHGRTHHMRAMHLNTHKRQVNPINEEIRNHPSDSDSEDIMAVDSETLSSNRGPSLPWMTRIEHPHLTGTMLCFSFRLLDDL